MSAHKKFQPKAQNSELAVDRNIYPWMTGMHNKISTQLNGIPSLPKIIFGIIVFCGRIKKGCFFLLFCVFFDLESESEVRFGRSPLLEL